MDSYRSKSSRDGREMQVENGSGRDLAVTPSGMNDLITRSYSTSHAYASSSVHPPPLAAGYNNSNNVMGKEMEMKKVKKNSNQGGSIGKTWSFSDPELKRKKRVAGYKIYTVQGKMKGSFRKSFRWIKDIVYKWS